MDDSEAEMDRTMKEPDVMFEGMESRREGTEDCGGRLMAGFGLRVCWKVERACVVLTQPGIAKVVASTLH